MIKLNYTNTYDKMPLIVIKKEFNFSGQIYIYIQFEFLFIKEMNLNPLKYSSYLNEDYFEENV